MLAGTWVVDLRESPHPYDGPDHRSTPPPYVGWLTACVDGVALLSDTPDHDTAVARVRHLGFAAPATGPHDDGARPTGLTRPAW